MAPTDRQQRPNNCPLCFEEFDDLHIGTPNHAFNYMLSTYQKNKRSLRSDRNGVEINIDLKKKNCFNYMFDTSQKNKKGKYFLNMTPEQFALHGCEVEFSCEIKNIKKQTNIALIYAGVLHPYQPFSVIDPNNNLQQGKYLSLKPGEKYGVKVALKLHKSYVSIYKIPIFFSVQTYGKHNEDEMTTFSIARSIIVNIKEDILKPEILEKSPFTHHDWQRVDVRKHSKRFKPSDHFKIVQKYKRSLVMWSFGQEHKMDPAIFQEFQVTLFPGVVTEDNYAEFWKTLLWLEETSTKIALQAYNMEKVTLQYHSQGLRLAVPGLGEKRPSVIKGDSIEIKIHESTDKSYEGFIGHVGDKTVDITELDDEIVQWVKRHPDVLIDVKFVLGRIHFERMHLGVQQVALNGFTRQLFPDEKLLNRRFSKPITLSLNDLHNKDIYRNNEQMTAVTNIVNLTSKGAAPYIVNGPPGTGKTVTITEAIYQLKRRTNLKILVCAPANAACHMLTDKLAEFCDTSELMRVMSEQCDTSSIHDNIVKYCNVTRIRDATGVDKLKVVPFLEKNLNKFRIVVTTLVFAGKYTRVYHPDVVFLDEAAQAREPEACCAISLLMPDKFVVLAGDSKQLGPVVHNEVCKKFKYDISLMERLINLPLYQKDQNNNFTTMLKLNFRSHKEILAMPNELFYGKLLKACSVKSTQDPLALTFINPIITSGEKYNQRGGAVEFCAVLAKEQRHGRSPSYFNTSEVNMVLKYVIALMLLEFPDRKYNLKASEIGIVTPYIRQVYKIREVLAPLYKDDIEVGTTEAFQGREKRVIIISTVRGQHDLLLEDKKYKIGFVHEPKRFNVAVTRAKTKLIVIGNPLILNRDENWKKLIEQSIRLKTHCGAPYTLRDQAERENIIQRFGNLQMKDSFKEKK